MHVELTLDLSHTLQLGPIDTITALTAITQWDAVAALCETINAKDDG